MAGTEQGTFAVIGDSGGIGEAIRNQLLEAGHHVIGVSRKGVSEQRSGYQSLVFDAVALVVSSDGAEQLMTMPPARDFVTDAFAHHKFTGYTEAARPLLDLAGPEQGRSGLVALARAADADAFVEACRALRSWERG